MNEVYLKRLFISLYALLYIIVSTVAMLDIIEMLQSVTNNKNLSIALGIAYELGAAATLVSLAVLDKLKRWLVLALFMVMGIMSASSQVFVFFTNQVIKQSIAIPTFLNQLGIYEGDASTQYLAVSIFIGLSISFIALGSVKSLVDYLKPTKSLSDIEIENLNAKLIEAERLAKENMAQLEAENKARIELYEKQLSDARMQSDAKAKEHEDTIKSILDANKKATEDIVQKYELSILELTTKVDAFSKIENDYVAKLDTQKNQFDKEKSKLETSIISLKSQIDNINKSNGELLKVTEDLKMKKGRRSNKQLELDRQKVESELIPKLKSELMSKLEAELKDELEAKYKEDAVQLRKTIRSEEMEKLKNSYKEHLKNHPDKPDLSESIFPNEEPKTKKGKSEKNDAPEFFPHT